MNEMEKKLAEYRSKKAREAKMNQIKAKAQDLVGKLWKKEDRPEPDIQATEALIKEESEGEALEVLSTTSEEELNCCTWSDIFYYGLWAILWVTLYIIFIEFQFGTVFLIISAIVFIFVNTRTRPKKRGEVSAYSVFNKNCKSIDGTLKAEQFEREIRYGY